MEMPELVAGAVGLLERAGEQVPVLLENVLKERSLQIRAGEEVVAQRPERLDGIVVVVAARVLGMDVRPEAIGEA